MNCIEYSHALAIQQQYWKQKIERIPIDSDKAKYFLFNSHHPVGFLFFVPPAVYTLGRSLTQERALNLYPGLRSKTVIESTRGGDVTYHGPGQIVIFPVPHPDLSADDCRRLIQKGPRVWVCYLQTILIQLPTGLTLTSKEGFPGVWVDEKTKLASIGLRFSPHGIFHGMSVNLDQRIHDGFRWIDPCGLPDVHASSFEDCGVKMMESEFCDLWMESLERKKFSETAVGRHFQ